MFDLQNNLGEVLLMEPADKAHTSWASSWLDVADFEGAVLSAIICALTGVDASNYIVCKLQESDTTADGDAADVAAADCIGAFAKIDATTKDSVVQSVGYKGAKRYVRVAGTYTGMAISAGICGVVGRVGHARTNPVTAPAAVAAT